MKNIKNTVFITVLLTVWFASCVDEPVLSSEPETNLLFSHPRYGEVPLSADNSYTDARLALGKKLFYDKRLSLDSSISCASCHNPNLAFADTLSISPGVFARLGTRNAPSLANVGYQSFLNREGNLPTLEMQMLVPIQEHAEFGFNMIKLVERLSTDNEVQKMSLAAYGRILDPFVVTRSIGLFERSIISSNSKLDQFLAGNIFALTPPQKQGLALFNEHCTGCHVIDKLQPLTIANNGIYETYKDPGLMRISRLMQDEGKFKVPTLQNIAITPPYMHDGSMKTLDEVLAHYNNGGQNHPNKSVLVKKLGMTSNDLTYLKAFLKTMTDEQFLKDPTYR